MLQILWQWEVNEVFLRCAGIEADNPFEWDVILKLLLELIS
jgi:hypothetical protein